MDYPEAKVVGHRDLSPDVNGNGEVEPMEWTKECPCFKVEKRGGEPLFSFSALVFTDKNRILQRLKMNPAPYPIFKLAQTAKKVDDTLNIQAIPKNIEHEILNKHSIY